MHHAGWHCISQLSGVVWDGGSCKGAESMDILAPAKHMFFVIQVRCVALGWFRVENRIPVIHLLVFKRFIGFRAIHRV